MQIVPPVAEKDSPLQPMIISLAPFHTHKDYKKIAFQSHVTARLSHRYLKQTTICRRNRETAGHTITIDEQQELVSQSSLLAHNPRQIKETLHNLEALP
jgi:uncharacterized protein YdeI (YjbR/CyaY-like superfamily)